MSTHPLRTGPDRDSPAFFCKSSPTNLFRQSASLEHCRAEFSGAKTNGAMKPWRLSGPQPVAMIAMMVINH